MDLHRSAAYRYALGLTALFGCLIATPVHAQLPAHQHGVIGLELALSGASLAMTVDAPLDSLLGFERAPRNNKERAAASKVIEAFANAATLFELPAAAGCVARRALVSAPALQGSATSGHAELNAQYQWDCASPARLDVLYHRLFERYAGASRIALQGVHDGGQFKQVIKRPQNRIQIPKR